jgi:hypothetical protein
MPKTSATLADGCRGLVVAALVLLLVLVVTYMALQLYNLHKGAAPEGPRAREPFIATLYYSPSCGSEWLGRRRSECRGITTGVMPSIELTTNFGHSLCSGRLGVPP